MELFKKLLTVFFAASLCAGVATAGQTLTYSDHEPLDGMRTRFIKDVFFAAIEEESNGRLKIEDHWGGELARSYDALRTVGREGKVDMAVVVPEYTSAELPRHQLFKSFPVGPFGDRQVEFFRRVDAEMPEFREELNDEEVIALLFATGFPVAFFSAKPLDTLEDIKGGKWRSASFWHRDFLQNTGAEPVSLPWGDGISQAMRNGTLDGLMVNIDSGFEIKAHHVAPNVLLSKDLWLGHLYIVTMNRNTWDSLPEEDRAAIRRAAETAYQTLGQVMERSFDEAVETMQKEGVNLRILDSGEVARWEAATRYREAQAAWVKEQEEKGVQDIARILEQVDAIRKQVMK